MMYLRIQNFELPFKILTIALQDSYRTADTHTHMLIWIFGRPVFPTVSLLRELAHLLQVIEGWGDGGGEVGVSFRKHTYSNILKFSPPKTESFQINIQIFFPISTQNIDCVCSLESSQRGSSN